MPRQNGETAEDAKMRYSAAYPTGRERMDFSPAVKSDTM